MKLPNLFIAFVLSLAPALPAFAGPGAHGPNGEHLEGPAGGTMQADGRPRMEAFTELFELVARLEDKALTTMVNVYQTNVPVDGAEIEVESNGVTAKATFDAATGAYRFADARLVALLAKPGKHSLAFTVTAGEDFDIVAGALDVTDHEASAGGDGIRWWHITLILLALLVVVFFFLRRRAGRRLVFAGVRR